MRAQRKCLLTALSAEIRTWLSRSWFYFCNNWQTGWHKCTRPIKEWGMVNQLNAISDYFNQLVGNSSVHNKLKSKAREKLWRQCDWLNEAGRGILTAFTRVSWRMELSSIRPSLWLVGMIEKEKMTNIFKRAQILCFLLPQQLAILIKFRLRHQHRLTASELGKFARTRRLENFGSLSGSLRHTNRKHKSASWWEIRAGKGWLKRNEYTYWGKS